MPAYGLSVALAFLWITACGFQPAAGALTSSTLPLAGRGASAEILEPQVTTDGQAPAQYMDELFRTAFGGKSGTEESLESFHREEVMQKHHWYAGSRCITLNHLEKAAGSFVRSMLQASLAVPWRLEEERDLVSLRDVAKSNFVIGLARNPLDWYVSLWSWSARNPGSWGRKRFPEVFPNTTSTNVGSTEEERDLFRKFVRLLCSEQVGSQSIRLYKYYMDAKHHGFRQSLDKFPSHLTKGRQLRVVKAMSDFADGNGGTSVSCWVRAERALTDLRHCLVMYEKDYAVSAVNWSRFEDVVDKVDTNKVQHEACSVMYDDETKRLVQQAEQHLFRAFQYPDRCNDIVAPSRIGASSLAGEGNNIGAPLGAIADAVPTPLPEPARAGTSEKFTKASSREGTERKQLGGGAQKWAHAMKRQQSQARELHERLRSSTLDELRRHLLQHNTPVQGAERHAGAIRLDEFVDEPDHGNHVQDMGPKDSEVPAEAPWEPFLHVALPAERQQPPAEGGASHAESHAGAVRLNEFDPEEPHEDQEAPAEEPWQPVIYGTSTAEGQQLPAEARELPAERLAGVVRLDELVAEKQNQVAQEPDDGMRVQDMEAPAEEPWQPVIYDDLPADQQELPAEDMEAPAEEPWQPVIYDDLPADQQELPAEARESSTESSAGVAHLQDMVPQGRALPAQEPWEPVVYEAAPGDGQQPPAWDPVTQQLPAAAWSLQRQPGKPQTAEHEAIHRELALAGAPRSIDQEQAVSFRARVDSAIYRSTKHKERFFDVTAEVNRLIQRHGVHNVTGGQGLDFLFGDPAMGERKMLRVRRGRQVMDHLAGSARGSTASTLDLSRLWASTPARVSTTPPAKPMEEALLLSKKPAAQNGTGDRQSSRVAAPAGTPAAHAPAPKSRVASVLHPKLGKLLGLREVVHRGAMTVDSAIYRSITDTRHAKDVTEIVNHLILKHGFTNMTAGQAFNYVFGDPAPGSWKMLHVKRKGIAFDLEERDQGAEHASYDISPLFLFTGGLTGGPSEDMTFPFRVDKAVYRSVDDSSKRFTVTDMVNQLILKNGVHDITNGTSLNLLFGDPAPGLWKKLFINRGGHRLELAEIDASNGHGRRPAYDVSELLRQANWDLAQSPTPEAQVERAWAGDDLPAELWRDVLQSPDAANFLTAAGIDHVPVIDSDVIE